MHKNIAYNRFHFGSNSSGYWLELLQAGPSCGASTHVAATSRRWP